MVAISRFFKALGVAVKNGARSFQDYYDRELDPLTRDALTLAYNRPCFERRRKSLRSSYALLLIDIDNFKHINDLYGHATGDLVLSAVGKVLRTSSGDRVFRIGGEEFAVLLAGCSPDDAVRVAERLCATVRGLEVLDDRRITVSVGVAWSGELPPDHEAIFRRADRALYQAKGAGKNRVARLSAAGGACPRDALV